MTQALCSSLLLALRRGLLLLCVSLAAALPLHAGVLGAWAPLYTRLSATAIVPVQFANGAMLVDVTINGQGPFHMLVDTGCSATVISPAVALAVEAHSPDDLASMPAIDSLGSVGSVSYVVLESLQLGGARFEGVSAGVTSLDLQSKITAQRIDGLLGYSLFSDLFLALDFPNQRLVLSQDFPPGLAPVRSEIAIQEINAVPFVPLTLQGREFLMMVDSGANGSLELNLDEATDLNWKIAPRAAGLSAALGGIGRDWIGRLNGTATLGSLTQPEPIMALGAGTSRIGTAFLRTACLVFNRAQDKLWICSTSTAPLPSDARRTVGLSLLADATGWRVVGTIPDSPAEKARLAPGDLIASIEDTPALTWSRDDIQRWMDRHPALTLSVAGAAGSRRVALPVWSVVP